MQKETKTLAEATFQQLPSLLQLLLNSRKVLSKYTQSEVRFEARLFQQMLQGSKKMKEERNRRTAGMKKKNKKMGGGDQSGWTTKSPPYFSE